MLADRPIELPPQNEELKFLLWSVLQTLGWHLELYDYSNFCSVSSIGAVV